MGDPELQEIAEQKPKPKPKRRKLVEVYVVSQKGGSALVQWGPPEDRHRGYIPAEEVEGGKVAKAVLDAAIPYGLPWEELVDLSDLTPEKFACELRRAGVWTLEDLAARATHAKHALSAATAVTLSALRKAAQELEAKEAE
jgi:hypothetical protein